MKETTFELSEKDMHRYQFTGVDHVMQHRFCALFLEMGLGKTVTLLTAVMRLIYEELDINSALVIAPKRVAESVWSAEAEKWEHVSGLKIIKIIGNEKKRKAALKEKGDIYMISRDNIAWLCGQFGGLMLPWDMLIVDESSSFRNPKSMRFKALRRVQASFRRVVILTGTPAPKGLIDLWGQVYLLDRGERLGKTITEYRETYFSPGKRRGDIVFNYDLKKGGEAQIYSKLSDICMSMKAKDYLELPPRIDNYIKLEFPEDLRAQYDEFERSQILQLIETDGEISAMNASALSNKLLQFANGAVYDEHKNYHTVHDLKLDAAEEIIEAANGKPVLIAYTFIHDLERLMVKLKKYKPKKLETDQDIKDWNAGKIQVMIMHPASGGHGLNLQAGGNIIIWFGQTWDLELYQQFNARLARQGQQADSVIINHLVAKKTVDEDVIKSLANKDYKQEGLMRAMKAKIDKYKSFF